ncbi:MAG TPA: glycoside hydrolase, partial [Gammaproteobacteria bacterium]
MPKPWRALLLLLSVAGAAHGATAPTTVSIGHDSVALTGPWKFQVGDDLRSSEPGFDDSHWEDMDLSAPPDASDGDVGITPYISGWDAKGHPRYQGYAWYRLRITANVPAGETLELLGPWAVDSVYQVYVNGTLLGGVGDFSGTTPTAYGTHYPTRFALPPGLARGGPLLLAIRVWSGPWAVGAGGIHVAPAIGTQAAIDAHYRLQWLTIFEGYMVDTLPALLFSLMALLVLCFWYFDRSGPANPWLAAALLLSGIQRGNQAFFFWWQIETIQAFVLVILVLVGSLSLGAWMMAWRSWFKLERPAWVSKAICGLTLLLILSRFLGYLPALGTSLPHWLTLTAHYADIWIRYAFIVTLGLIAYGGIRLCQREGLYTLPAILAIATVLFAGELSALHVPGIWFPWGIGVSLGEYAAVVFDVLLAALLLRRLWSYAPSRTQPA